MSDKLNANVGFLGAGNMGSALLRALVGSGRVPKERVCALLARPRGHN